MCWKCGNVIAVTEPVSRSAECPVCHRDLRCCRNCKFYAPGSHYDCHETVDELVKDKESANFCDCFSLKRDFSDANGSNAVGGTDKTQKAKDAFNSLFSI